MALIEEEDEVITRPKTRKAVVTDDSLDEKPKQNLKRI